MTVSRCETFGPRGVPNGSRVSLGCHPRDPSTQLATARRRLGGHSWLHAFAVTLITQGLTEECGVTFGEAREAIGVVREENHAQDSSWPNTLPAQLHAARVESAVGSEIRVPDAAQNRWWMESVLRRLGILLVGVGSVLIRQVLSSVVF